MQTFLASVCLIYYSIAPEQCETGSAFDFRQFLLKTSDFSSAKSASNFKVESECFPKF